MKGFEYQRGPIISLTVPSDQARALRQEALAERARQNQALGDAMDEIVQEQLTEMVKCKGRKGGKKK